MKAKKVERRIREKAKNRALTWNIHTNTHACSDHLPEQNLLINHILFFGYECFGLCVCVCIFSMFFSTQNFTPPFINLWYYKHGFIFFSVNSQCDFIWIFTNNRIVDLSDACFFFLLLLSSNKSIFDTNMCLLERLFEI